MTIAAILVIFPFCMAYAAVTDIFSMTISNRVHALLVLSFAVLAPMTGMDWETIGVHFLAAIIVLAVTFTLFAFGTMGGGDAKLLAATSLWFGLGMTLMEYLLYSALLGGLLTFAIILFRNSPMAVFSGHLSFLKHIADERKGIPYGIALGSAGLLVFPSSPIGIWVLAQLS